MPKHEKKIRAVETKAAKQVVQHNHQFPDDEQYLRALRTSLEVIDREVRRAQLALWQYERLLDAEAELEVEHKADKAAVARSGDTVG